MRPTSTLRYATRPASAASWAFADADTSPFGARQTETKLLVDQAGHPHIFFVKSAGLYVVERCP